jgi:hypothetical protein
MARIALRALITAALFGLIWAFTWPIYFDKQIRHDVNPEWGKTQIYTDPDKQKVVVHIDGRTEYLPNDKYEESAAYKEAMARLHNAKHIDEVGWRLKQRAGRAIVCLIALLYIASGRLLEFFEEPPRKGSWGRI